MRTDRGMVVGGNVENGWFNQNQHTCDFVFRAGLLNFVQKMKMRPCG